MSQKQQLETAYSSILVTDPARQINVNPDIQYNAMLVRDAFNKAAQGQQAVDRDLVETLIQRPLDLYRSNPFGKDQDFTGNIREILNIGENYFSLTEEELAALPARLDALKGQLALKAGVPADFLPDIHKQAMTYQDVAATIGLSDPAQFAVSMINQEINKISKMPGAVSQDLRAIITGNDWRPQMLVARYEDGIERTKLNTFDPGDQPLKPFPGTKEQFEFIISLHESEHATLTQNSPFPKNKPGDAVDGQILEIDADSSILAALNDFESPAIKDYWLQTRNIASFKDGLAAGNYSHDTATFLRVYEQTGQQIDLEKFRQEKTGLMLKIQEKLNVSPNAEPKAGDIMGAVQDILREDKTLSPVQRQEAEQFLKDGEALGYRANPDYPRPAEQNPDIALFPQRPAPAAPGLG